MITCQIESFMESTQELEELFPLHYEELALNKDKVPLSPRYEAYARSESAGELFFVTLRKDGEMIGYYVGVVGPGLHYSTCLTCVTDMFFIKKEHRGKSGKMLFSFVESQLRNIGVNRWFVGSKSHSDVTGFLKKCGFEQIETYHSKWLED